MCSPISCTVNGYQQIDVGEKALQCVSSWKRGVHLHLFPSHAGVCSSAWPLRRHPPFLRVQCRVMGALTWHTIGQLVAGKQTKSCCFWKTFASSHARQGTSLGVWKLPRTGIRECTQKDQQACPNPVPTASTAYFETRAGSEKGPCISCPAPPLLHVCSWITTYCSEDNLAVDCSPVHLQDMNFLAQWSLQLDLDKHEGWKLKNKLKYIMFCCLLLHRALVRGHCWWEEKEATSMSL